MKSEQTEIQKVLNRYARQGKWKNWDEFELDAGGDGYPEMIKEAVIIAYRAGIQQGKKELAKELLCAPVNTEEMSLYLVKLSGYKPNWLKSELAKENKEGK